METPVQKSYSTHNLILAALLFVFFWLTGNSLYAEVVGPTTYLGEIAGATAAPFVLSTIVLLLLRIFGVRWNNRAFFYLALVFAIIALIQRLSGKV